MTSSFQTVSTDRLNPNAIRASDEWYMRSGREGVVDASQINPRAITAKTLITDYSYKTWPGGYIHKEDALVEALIEMAPDSKPSCEDLNEEVHSHVPKDCHGPRSVTEEERDKAWEKYRSLGDSFEYFAARATPDGEVYFTKVISTTRSSRWKTPRERLGSDSADPTSR